MVLSPTVFETLSLFLIFGLVFGILEKVNKNEVVSDFIAFWGPKLNGLSEEDSVFFGPILPNIRKIFGF